MVFFKVVLCLLALAHYSSGQCATISCGEEETPSCKNVLERNLYLLEEVRRNRNKLDNINLSSDESPAPPAELDTNCTKPIQYSGVWRHCSHVYKTGYIQSGVYRIRPAMSATPVDVYCDHSNGGGWTVFQRRVDGDMRFDRTWKEYKEGFGDLMGEFWRGNDLLSMMTEEFNSTLRIDLMDFNWITRYAQYNSFRVLPENHKYKLQIGNYTGTAGDNTTHGLSYNNAMPFSTVDQDNDKWSGHCASDVTQGGGGSGWWYNKCTTVNLNGPYKYRINGAGDHRYIVWQPWKQYEQLQKAEMKFRPMDH